MGQTLSAATAVQGIAATAGNQKLATALSVISVTLLAIMTWGEMTHLMKEHARELDRRHSQLGDRRR